MIEKETEWLDKKGSINTDRPLDSKFCERPFTNIEVQNKGQVYLCCPDWLPTAVGNLLEQDLDTIWNSEGAQDIRRSILDGTFEYCDQHQCPLISRDEIYDKKNFSKPPWDGLCNQYINNNETELESPTFFNFCYDISCNLQCPSCRTRNYNYAKGYEYEQIIQIHEKAVNALYRRLEDKKGLIFLSLSGSGDPFVSRVYQSLLNELDGEKYPNLRINIQTNGLLFTPKAWASMEKIHNNIQTVIVSVDAATEETYRKIRPPGDFNVLLNNLEFISGLAEKEHIKELRLDFIIQQKNYKEMSDFIRLARRFPSVDRVSFGLLADWKTWPKKEYEFHAIWKSYHPEFYDFLDVINSPVFDDTKYAALPFRYRQMALKKSKREIRKHQ